MLFLQLLVWLCDSLLCLVMWWVTLVDFQMLNQPFPSGVNRTWSWCIQRRQWRPTPVLLPGKPHGRRSLAGCSPWGPEEADTTERLHSHFFPALEKEMATQLQSSSLENPRDRGAWWAAVYGVPQSWAQLKRLSSSSVMYKHSYILGDFIC